MTKLQDIIQCGKIGNAEIIKHDGILYLLIDGLKWMSDEYYEYISNAEIIERAHGDVLIAGLGLGLILLPMFEDDKVETITVLENNHNVIDLVFPMITQADTHSKLDVIYHDANILPDGEYDTIFLDVQNNESEKKQSDELKEKYRAILKPGGYISAWLDFYPLKK